MTDQQRPSTIVSNDRIGPAVLAAYLPFALGGVAAQTGHAGRIVFALLYIASAVCTP